MAHFFVLNDICHEVSPACVRACLTFYSDCVSWSLLITPCPNKAASTSAKRSAFGYYIFANIVCVQKEHIRTNAVPWGIPNLAGIEETEIAGDNKDNKPLTSTVWCRVVSHFSSHALRFTWIPWRSNSAKRSWWGTLSNAFEDQRRLRWPRSSLRAVVQ